MHIFKFFIEMQAQEETNKAKVTYYFRKEGTRHVHVIRQSAFSRCIFHILMYHTQNPYVFAERFSNIWHFNSHLEGPFIKNFMYPMWPVILQTYMKQECIPVGCVPPACA